MQHKIVDSVCGSKGKMYSKVYPRGEFEQQLPLLAALVILPTEVWP